MQFNPEQMQAVTFTNGPCLVLAGPGSGKTAVITGRLLYLIEQEGVLPSSLLTITFTKAAALEMQSRFYKLSDSKYPEVCFGTFHSVFYQIIRQSLQTNTPKFMNYKDAYGIAEQVMKERGVKYSTESIRSFLAVMSAQKNGKVRDESLMTETIFERLDELIICYERLRQDLHLMDFDDILPTCLQIFRQSPQLLEKWRSRFKYVQTDEFQDVNDVQIEALKILTSPSYNLFAVGDDDQAIYSFRGASPSAMISFEQTFPHAKTISLKTNYRSVPKIIRAATQVISVNTQRLSKESCPFRTERQQDAVSLLMFENENDEKRALVESLKSIYEEDCSSKTPEDERIHPKTVSKLSNTAVLFRTNRQASDFALLLNENHIPFYMREKMISLTEQAQVQDMIAYLRAASGDVLRQDFLRIMNKPIRYISRDAVSTHVLNRNMFRRHDGHSSYMLKKIDKLFRDLELIGRLSPKRAIHYIRLGIGYERYCRELSSAEEFERTRQILDQLEEKAGLYSDISEFLIILEDESNLMREINENNKLSSPGRDGVRLMTLHASKGLEFENVFIPFLNEGVIPGRAAITNELREEERRLFYVGMTRACDRLILSCVKNNRKNISSFLSPIVGEIPKKTYKAEHLC